MIDNDRVPFVDLVGVHRELEEELVAVFRTVLRSASFVGGPMVEGFEADFARFCGTKYCIGVGSGTDALRFALIAAGVGSGDIVITVPNTFIATTEAISQAGAVPDFVDVAESTCNMDPEKLREYLETRCHVGEGGKPVHAGKNRPVSAIIPVHLYGQPADMDAILALARAYNLAVIEDACQAHGAQYYSRREKLWKRAGSMGAAAAFSFYPGKNLGACGEAGAVTTDDETIARKIGMIRDHGQKEKYIHEMEGYNGRLDALQAGILRVKLTGLDEANKRRREAALRYNRLLEGVDGSIVPTEPSWARSVYHLYVLRSRMRDVLRQHLSAKGISYGLHYPVPLHLQAAYSHLGYGPGDFPAAEKLSREILSLPMFPALGVEQQKRIAELIGALPSRRLAP